MRDTIVLLALAVIVFGNPVIYDGRVPFATKNSALDASSDPFLTVVKGSTQNATHYSTFLGHLIAPTPLWNQKLTPFLSAPTEQVISVTIDNSSVFIPGSGPPQLGFRRTELIAQQNGSHTALNALIETGVSAFHFSIQMDKKRPLNYNHEYQVVFIEPSDGSHVFGIQLGSPFTNPTGTLPSPNAHSFKVLDHALNNLFVTPFLPDVWHNFVIEVDWNNRTLQIFYSVHGEKVRPVTKVLPNPTTQLGLAGQGDFHFGVLKLPLVDKKDSVTDQGDVVHHGIQEGTIEGLFYSGVFVERVDR